MPSPQKVKWSQLKVGLLALAAMIILAVLSFLLTQNGGLFHRTAILRTYLDDSAGMAVGATVRLNGIAIGSIDKVQLSGQRTKGKIVEISMQVKHEYLQDIPTDSKAGISAANLLGDKYINITMGKLPNHVQDGDTVESLQVQDIPELMAQSSDILAQFQGLLGRVDNIVKNVEEGHGNIGKLYKDEELYDRFNATAGEIKLWFPTFRTRRHHQQADLRRWAVQRYPEAHPAPRRHHGGLAERQRHGRQVHLRSGRLR